MSSSEASASLLEALEANRTDILKSILDHLGQDERLLREVLASQCCSAGTLLHAAVAKDSADAVRQVHIFFFQRKKVFLPLLSKSCILGWISCLKDKHDISGLLCSGILFCCHTLYLLIVKCNNLYVNS